VQVETRIGGRETGSCPHEFVTALSDMANAYAQKPGLKRRSAFRSQKENDDEEDDFSGSAFDVDRVRLGEGRYSGQPGEGFVHVGVFGLVALQMIAPGCDHEARSYEQLLVQCWVARHFEVALRDLSTS